MPRVSFHYASIITAYTAIEIVPASELRLREWRRMGEHALRS